MWGCDPQYDQRPDDTCFSLEPTGFITVKGWMPTNVDYLRALEDGLLLAFSGVLGVDERSVDLVNVYQDRGIAKIEVRYPCKLLETVQTSVWTLHHCEA
jgi:hypothetical protein